MLSVHQLSKTFEPGFFRRLRGETAFNAVENISFTVDKGAIVGILGPNGAGKTTTMHMLLGTLTPSSGEITYFGKSFSQNKSTILEKVGFASTYISLPSRLSVEENLEICGRLYGLSSRERKAAIARLLNQFGIESLKNKQVGALSAGQITRAMLAKAFIADPKIVLLDEPTASLDPDIAAETRQFILQQQEEHGTSILLASHDMDEVTQLCDRVLVMQRGKIIDDDTPVNLASRMHVSKLVLMLADDTPKAVNLAEKNNYKHFFDGNLLHIELDEHLIAQFLRQLTQNNIEYSQIYIEKPSLEDYFISIASQARSSK